jgi:hypothetical protein
MPSGRQIFAFFALRTTIEPKIPGRLYRVEFLHSQVNNGITGPLALGPLRLSHLTSVMRVGTSRLCRLRASLSYEVVGDYLFGYAVKM